MILIWHLHHCLILEPLTEPIDRRIAWIKDRKPADEVELRLRLMKPVKGKLPVEVIKAANAYVKTWAICDVWGTRDTAWGALRAALERHKAEVDILHTAECPNCPWDGETIFPGKD